MLRATIQPSGRRDEAIRRPGKQAGRQADKQVSRQAGEKHRDRPPIHGGGLTCFLWNGAVVIVVAIPFEET